MFLFRYLSFLLLMSRLALFAQPEAAPVEPPATPAVPAVEPQEAPPEEPVEKPAPIKRRQNQRLTVTRNQNVAFGENLVVSSNDTIREIVLIGGSADIQGKVERDVVIIGGSAKISGTVGGELVLVGGRLDCSGEIRRHAHVILGRADLSDSAHIGKGAVFIGGPFKIAPGAAIMGERTIIPFGDVLPKIEGLKAWLVKGLLWGRLLPVGVRWAWIAAGFFVGLYLLTLVLFPAGVKSIFLTLEERPVTSILSGFLTLILFAPLVALLAAAVIGIPVIPFLQIGLILAVIFGKAGVMCFLGRSFGRSAGGTLLQAPLVAFLIGATILVLAYMIPFFGVFAWALATVFGLGGAVVALSRTFSREDANVPPAPVMLSPVQPVPATGPTLGVSGFANPPVVGSSPLAPGETVFLRRAGFWKRVLAALLDWILLGFLVPVLGKYFIPVAVAYFVAMWAWKGTTIGSLVLGLKIVRADGRPINFSVALVRSLSSLFSAMVLFIGFLWAAWDRDKQSWHDKIAGTVVVQMPKGFALI